MILHHGTRFVSQTSLPKHRTQWKGRQVGMDFIVTAHVVLPVLIGGFIYLTWRADSLLMFEWCRRLRIYPLVAILRHHFFAARCDLPEWMLYSLPDAMWVYAATALQLLIWRHHNSSFASWLWISIPPLLAVGGELGQLSGVLPGTFCLCDLALCLLATTAAITLMKRRRE